jgi:hypothetical protein
MIPTRSPLPSVFSATRWLASPQQLKRWAQAGWTPPPPASSTEPQPPHDDLVTDWQAWLRTLFPEYFTADFATFHAELWRWVWAMEYRHRPVPFVGIWPRDTGKSTSAEAACVAVAARKARRYGLYVCRTQDQADDHVQNVAAQLESEQVAERYPALSNRLIGKFGASKGWRHNRLRTADGFTLDAVGLDRAVRGIKIEEQRPDFMVLDDLDNESDSPLTVSKNVRTLTRKVLQLGSDDVAIIAVQNLVHDESIFGRLAGTSSISADFLADRTVSGPHKAVNGLTYERRGTRTVLTGGEPTWPGLDLKACQQRVDRDGIDAFLAECQHEKQRPEGVAFPEWRREVHVCQPFRVPLEWPRWRGLDYGYGVPYCCLWGALAPSGTLYIYRETYRAGMLDRDQAFEIRTLSAGERIRGTFADPSMWTARHNGYAIQAPATAYAEMGVGLTAANNDRRVGKQRVHELLAWQPAEHDQPMIPPRIQIFSTCDNLIRTLPDLVKDADDPDDVDTTGEDHAFDGLKYLVLGVALPVLQRARVRFG